MRKGWARFGAVLVVFLAACRGFAPTPWEHDAFPLECKHATATCETCHTDGLDAPISSACESCHSADAPDNHGDDRTLCGDCHDACDWGSTASYHPDGFAEPGAHGLAANLQDPKVGACTNCHGADLSGGDGGAVGCDSCHSDNGHADWRTDCTYCHGGTLDTSGAPPEDIDNQADPDLVTFRAHLAHTSGPDHPGYACTQCHATYKDAYETGHAVDATAGVSEVTFAAGLSATATYDGVGSCANVYCHGNGYAAGKVSDDQVPETCDSCHETTSDSDWEDTTLSGAHAVHLEEGISCADCHAGVVDNGLAITGPDLHVDGAVKVGFTVGGIHTDDGGATCTGACHGFDHGTEGWGHPPGYEAPEMHGLEANLQTLDCQKCHGNDLAGSGVAVGCDDCHATSGHSDWRTDCTFCHGGTDGDIAGLPPEDIDNETDEDLISFKAHREHAAGASHVAYDCETCHLAKPADVLSLNHAIDSTPGSAEVDFADGLGAGGAYSFATATCTNTYCHGDGRVPGDVADAATPTDCNSCHKTTANLDQLSGSHDVHLAESGITCASCHGDVVDASGAIVGGSLHVDGVVDINATDSGWDPATQTCTTTCHGEDHTDRTWFGHHPTGYSDADYHGRDALSTYYEGDCRDCHGSDLGGGTAGVACDSCHEKGWISNCTYCHGGTLDSSGTPPMDLDGQTDEDLITFKSHPEHMDSSTHATYDCDECHIGAAASYTNALTDTDHWFDSSLGQSEVSFDAGLSSGGTYDYVNTCGNIYCHGNGQVDGSATDSKTALDCDACHSTTTDLGELSGTHSTHLAVTGVTCADCHTDVSTAGAISVAAQHVDGNVDLDESGAGWDPSTSTCTVTCHGKDHTDRSWDGHHPSGYDAGDQHGTDSLLTFAEGDCRTCHGSDLMGGTAGVACEDCHVSGWTTDCTYCHGGEVDSSGAPPQDLDNETEEALNSFKSHTVHLDSSNHATFDCDECHGSVSVAYVDALTDTGHWFDSTAGVSEVDFSDGLSAAGTYSTSGSCTVYCHGNGESSGSATVADTTTAMACDDCHPDDASSSSAYSGMSGDHRDHIIDEGAECYECHDDVVDSSFSLVDPSLHVDGVREVTLSSGTGMSISASKCTGRCHGSGDSHNDTIHW